MKETLDRAAWLRERSTFVGASEIGSILGLPGAYSSIGQVWLSKVRAQEEAESLEEATSIDPETAEKLDPKSMGLILEPSVLSMYEMRNPTFKVRRNGLQIWRHPQHPHIGATLDADAETEFGDKRIVEVKTQRLRQEWGDEGTDQVPGMFAAQGLQQMLIRESDGYATFCDFPVLFAHFDFKVFSVPYDRKAAQDIIDVLDYFWNLVETRTPPPIDYSDAGAAKLMRQIYNKIVGEPKVLSGPDAVRAAGLIYTRDYAHEEEKRWGAVKERCTAEMLAIAGNAPRVEIQLPGAKKPLAIIRSPREARIVEAYEIKAHHVLQFDPYQLPKRIKYLAELGDENVSEIETEKQKQIGGATAEITGEAV